MLLRAFMGFPGGSEVKASVCNVGDLGSIPGFGRSPGEGHPLQYSCLENPQGQSSQVGYSPLGHKELDMTEKLNGEGDGTPLQYFCLENPVDGGAW